MSNRHLPWIILFIAISFYCYEFFLRIVPSVVLMNLMGYFQISAFGIGALSSAYYFAYTLGQIPGGYLLDRFNSRWVLGFATLICALVTYSFIATHNYYIAISSRFLLGLASSVSFIGVLNLAKRYLPPHRFTFVAGIAISLGTLSAGYSQVVASHLLNPMHWPSLFYYSANLGIVLALVIFILLTVFKQTTISTPVKSTSFLTELTHIKKILTNPKIWLNGTIGGLFYLPTSVFAAVWGITFLETHYHINTTQAAQCVSFMFLGWVIGSPIVGYIAERYNNERQILRWGSILTSLLIFAIIFKADWIDANTISLYLAFLIFGILSSAQTVVWKFFKAIAPEGYISLSIAVTNMIIMLATAIAHLLVGYLIEITSHYTKTSAHLNYAPSLFVLPFALILATLIARYIEVK